MSEPEEPKLTRLPVSSIVAEYELQPRSHIDPGTVEDYVDVLADGVALPPVGVVTDGSTLWLVDGYHRLAAHIRAGLTEIEAEVFPGDFAAAVRRAIQANAAHGQRRNLADLQKGLELAMHHGLIADPPTDIEGIARILACPKRTAYRLIEPWREKARRERDRQIRTMHAQGAAKAKIAAEVGASRNTVRQVIRTADQREQRQADRHARTAAYTLAAQDATASGVGMTPMAAITIDTELTILFASVPTVSPEKAAAGIPEPQRKSRLEEAERLAAWLGAFCAHLGSRPSPTRH